MLNAYEKDNAFVVGMGTGIASVVWKLRLRGGKWLSQGYLTVTDGQEPVFDPRKPDFRAFLLPTTFVCQCWRHEEQ